MYLIKNLSGIKKHVYYIAKHKASKNVFKYYPNAIPHNKIQTSQFL